MAQGDFGIYQDTTGGQNLNSTSFTAQHYDTNLWSVLSAEIQ
jgi:hypothetical protein